MMFNFLLLPVLNLPTTLPPVIGLRGSHPKVGREGERGNDGID